ncbi:MAG: response regulator [Leptospirillia bacterium]
MPNAGPILIVEDDPNIAALVARYLDREGYRSVIVPDGASALTEAARIHPALVVLDLMLPKVDGWEVCRRLRRESDVPILMLTAREEEIDRVSGLSMGADDYVVKPFSPRELVERVKAVLRRSRPRVADPLPMTFGALVVEPDKHRVAKNGETLTLTPSEYKLLLTLMGTPGRVFTRDELIGRLHGTDGVVIDRVVDVHIGRLRQKIEDDPQHPDYILTVRGTGYRFADPREEALL